MIEFFSADIHEPDAQVAAMFATVGGSWPSTSSAPLQADESRRVEAMLRAERDRAQRYLDVAGTMIVVLDAGGRVLADQPQGLRDPGPRGDELLGADWFEVAVPEPERDAARAGFDADARAARRRRRALESGHDGRRQLRTIAWHTRSCATRRRDAARSPPART